MGFSSYVTLSSNIFPTFRSSTYHSETDQSDHNIPRMDDIVGDVGGDDDDNPGSQQLPPHQGQPRRNPQRVRRRPGCGTH